MRRQSVVAVAFLCLGLGGCIGSEATEPTSFRVPALHDRAQATYSADGSNVALTFTLHPGSVLDPYGARIPGIVVDVAQDPPLEHLDPQLTGAKHGLLRHGPNATFGFDGCQTPLWYDAEPFEPGHNQVDFEPAFTILPAAVVVAGRLIDGGRMEMPSSAQDVTNRSHVLARAGPLVLQASSGAPAQVNVYQVNTRFGYDQTTTMRYAPDAPWPTTMFLPKSERLGESNDVVLRLQSWSNDGLPLDACTPGEQAGARDDPRVALDADGAPPMPPTNVSFSTAWGVARDTNGAVAYRNDHPEAYLRHIAWHESSSNPAVAGDWEFGLAAPEQTTWLMLRCTTRDPASTPETSGLLTSCTSEHHSLENPLDRPEHTRVPVDPALPYRIATDIYGKPPTAFIFTHNAHGITFQPWQSTDRGLVPDLDGMRREYSMLYDLLAGRLDHALDVTPYELD